MTKTKSCFFILIFLLKIFRQQTDSICNFNALILLMDEMKYKTCIVAYCTSNSCSTRVRCKRS